MLKPYFNSTIHLQNLYTYRDYLKKRPKYAHQFKFAKISSQLGMNQADEKNVQFRLIRASKLLKSVPKVDLKEFIVENHASGKMRLLSAYKKVFRAKTFFSMNPKSYPKVKDFKYFPQLKHLVYQLGTPSQKYGLRNPQPDLAHNYLKYLKYSRKMSSFSFADFSSWHFPEMGIKGQSCLKSLEHLSLKREKLIQNEFRFPIEHCKNLKSVSFNFDDIRFSKPLAQMMDELPNIPNLQQICLSFDRVLIFDFLTPFKKITENGLLKKVKLEFGKRISSLDKILEALNACQLTHFSLKACFEVGLFGFLTKFLETMNHLESFELHIPDLHFFFYEDSLIIELCKQINQLRELRDLKLDFQNFQGFKSGKIANFTPFLCDLFTKPIKIETLSIACHQLDPSEVLESFLPLLEHSAAFLTHLRIDSRALTCNQKTYRSFIKFIRKLSSIQVLEIPCLAISGSTIQFLNEIAEIIHGLKELRVREIGKIKGGVILPNFYKTVEAILKKRGLRKFHCSFSHGLQMNLIRERNLVWFPDTKRILEKNPYLETLVITDGFHGFLGITSWTETINQR